MPYIEIEQKSWNRLINHGPTVLVATRSKDHQYNIAPIAWNCPVQKNPARVLAVIGHSHKTYTNIMETGEFVICVPHGDQAKLVLQTGKSKGEEINKFTAFSISYFMAEHLDLRIPEGCLGYLECKLSTRLPLEKVDIMVGEVLTAKVNRACFNERMLTEKTEAKSLHHLGGNTFSIPSDHIIEINEF